MSHEEIEQHLSRAGYNIQTLRPLVAEAALRELAFLADTNDKELEGYAFQYFNMKHQVAILSGQPEVGIGYLEKALALVKSDDGKSALCDTIARYHYYRTKDMAKMEEYADKALFFADVDDLKVNPISLKGFHALDEGRYKDAMQCFGDVEHYAELSHLPGAQATAIIGIAKVYRAMGKLETALSEMTRAERYAMDTHDFEICMKFFVKKADLLLTMGKINEAKKLISKLAQQEN